MKGYFAPSMRESEFNVSHYFTPSAAFLWPRSISLMLPYCDGGGGGAPMCLKKKGSAGV